jgi:cytochrome c peroxidase
MFGRVRDPRGDASPSSGSTWRAPVIAFVVAALIGFLALSILAPWRTAAPATAQGARDDLAALKAKFARPRFVPNPPDNLPTAARVALGKRLFEDKAISATGTVACSSCHDPKLSFTDGEPTGKGVTGKALVRHTPTLWNVAWSPLLFWDGRASSLEDQVRFPVQHPDEMGSTLENAIARFSANPTYDRDFAQAFPGNPIVSVENTARALAVYERTLVSPPTRFDRWIRGDRSALSPGEVHGFRLFTGRARCSSCHSGFAFTDHGFYDIGLPTATEDDLGRGPIVGLPAANHAFKVPTLRELAWTAPYMHDGSVGTLDDVVRIYEMGGIHRPTRAKDLPDVIRLTDEERDNLVAFLGTLSSDDPPQPSREAWIGNVAPASAPAPAQSTTVVSQAEKLFHPARIQLKAGQTLTVLNDDTRTHNVRIYDPRLDFNSGAQEPHESITIPFPERGTFEAFCGIHPTMRLTVEVK